MTPSILFSIALILASSDATPAPDVSSLGGTTDPGADEFLIQTPLCETCRHSTVIRGARLNDQIVECDRLFGHDQRVSFPVVSCSDYADRRQASVSDMEKIAWILRSDLLRSQAGFVRSSSLKEEERPVLEED